MKSKNVKPEDKNIQNHIIEIQEAFSTFSSWTSFSPFLATIDTEIENA